MGACAQPPLSPHKGKAPHSPVSPSRRSGSLQLHKQVRMTQNAAVYYPAVMKLFVSGCAADLTRSVLCYTDVVSVCHVSELLHV